jgi:hypothetical protein
MKGISKIILLFILVGCSPNAVESVEETEYQNFVATRKAEFDKINLPNPMQRNDMYQRVYEESGLQQLVLGSLLETAKPSLDELKTFYNDVIIGKYNGHVSQGQLKLAFINHAVRSVHLTNAQEKEFFAKLTRDLVALNGDTNPELTYTCLSSSKLLFGKDEFNEMIKKSKFKTRFDLEQAQQIIAMKKASDPEEQYERIAGIIKIFEKNLSDLEALKIR